MTPRVVGQRDSDRRSLSRVGLSVSRRALAAAATLIILTSNSTASSAMFVAYRQYWGLTPGDIGIAFSVYVGSLVPVLLLFGGLAERYGRRPIVLLGIISMLCGTFTLLWAHGLTELVVARLLQGVRRGARRWRHLRTFTEAYRGKDRRRSGAGGW